MKDNYKTDISEGLLLKYISGELPVSEHKKIEEWIDASEENKQVVRDIFSIYLASDTIQTIRSCKTSKALQKINKRINSSYKKRIFLYLQRIAAILLIPLIITFIYYLTQKSPVEYVELRTAPGMIGKIDLPDGTSVWLNSDSYIRHPQLFSGNTREVQIEGEAYFVVKKDKSKPFIIHTPSELDIEVLGTEFNIEAYKNTNTVKTILVSGSVKLSYTNDLNKKQSYILSPDQEFCYHTKTRNIEINKPYLPTLTAWKDGQVILRKTSFEDALKILSKRYNVEFIVKNINLYDDNYTATIKGEHILQILEYFRLASGIQYRFVESETENEKYKIMKKTIVELY